MEVRENPGVLLGGSLAEWTTLTTPQKFNIAPEKLPKPDRKGSSSFPAIFHSLTSLNFGCVSEEYGFKREIHLRVHQLHTLFSRCHRDICGKEAPPTLRLSTGYEAAVPNGLFRCEFSIFFFTLPNCFLACYYDIFTREWGSFPL